ncbi:PGAP1-like alpha/beta domain-containing protein [Arthrobacter sp. MDT3-24]
MALYGMDVESGRRLSEEFARTSDRLLALSGSLTPLITGAPWNGDDGKRFTDEWVGHRRQLIGTAHALAAASKAVKQNVEEQVAASRRLEASAAPQTTGGPSIFDQLMDSVADATEDLWDTAGEVTEAVGDTVSNTWHYVQEIAPLPIRNIMDAQGNVFSHAGNVAEMGWRWLTSGEPPSITELVSNSVMLAASLENLRQATFTLGFSNPHLFDDGRPVAGDPIAVGVGNPGKLDANSRGNTPVPSTVSAILATTQAAYGDQGKPGTPDTSIRIVMVNKPGEPPAYIVSIPGTTRWYPDGAANPTDLTGNLELAGGNMSTAAEAVRLAMEKAGIPPGAPVMLSGHSQGGMIAVALASDSAFTAQFNVTNVVTFGSPVDSAPIPPSIDVLALQHEGDPVPRVDLGDATVGPGPVGWPVSTSITQDNGATVVTMPNPDGGPGLANMSYHDGSAYVTSTENQESQGPIANYSQKDSTQKFLTSDASQVTSTVTNVSRKQ